MNITELQITGLDGAAILFVTTLAADKASATKPGTTGVGETLLGEARQRATDAFTEIRDLMDDILSAPKAGS